MNKGVFLKKLALTFAAVLFLGSVEVSAYTPPADSRLSLHTCDQSHTVDATDELFAENGEERDGEALSDACFVADDVRLRIADLVSEKISRIVIIPESSFIFSPQNSRAPPAI